MKPLILLVHGINTTLSIETVGKLRTFFECRGCPVVAVNYSYTGVMAARSKNPKVAKDLAKIIRKTKAAEPGRPVIVIGHSNGCAIIHIASTNFRAEIDTAIYINPALKKDLAIGSRVNECHIWHSPSDSPVKWSKRLSKIIPSSWFDARPWGEMGATGYIGNDERMINFNKEDDFMISSCKHSDVFEWQMMPYFGCLIADIALDSV